MQFFIGQMFTVPTSHVSLKHDENSTSVVYSCTNSAHVSDKVSMASKGYDPTENPILARDLSRAS